ECPPQPGIHCQLWRYFDSVLDEQRLSPVERIRGNILNVPRRGINLAQQHTRKGIAAQRDARLAGLEPGETEIPGAARLSVLVAKKLVLTTELNGVSPPNQREVLVDLRDSADKSLIRVILADVRIR